MPGDNKFHLFLFFVFLILYFPYRPYLKLSNFMWVSVYPYVTLGLRWKGIYSTEPAGSYPTRTLSQSNKAPLWWSSHDHWKEAHGRRLLLSGNIFWHLHEPQLMQVIYFLGHNRTKERAFQTNLQPTDHQIRLNETADLLCIAEALVLRSNLHLGDF